MRVQTLDDILDRIEAMHKAKLHTYTDLAEYLKKSVPRVYEYVNKREPMPPGDVALLMQAWVAARTLDIAKAGRKVEKAYRDAYKEVLGRRSR